MPRPVFLFVAPFFSLPLTVVSAASQNLRRPVHGITAGRCCPHEGEAQHTTKLRRLLLQRDSRRLLDRLRDRLCEAAHRVLIAGRRRRKKGLSPGEPARETRRVKLRRVFVWRNDECCCDIVFPLLALNSRFAWS